MSAFQFILAIIATIGSIATVSAGILGSLIFPRKKARKNRKILEVCFWFSVAIIALSTFSYMVLPRPIPSISSVQAQDSDIIAYDSTGSPIWRRELDSKISKVGLADINRDGKPEVIAGTTAPGKAPGWLYVYDERGNLVDKYNLWEESIYQTNISPQTHVIDFQVADLNNNGTTEIITISDDEYWYPSKVTVLSFIRNKLTKVSEYWNPGFITSLRVTDINHDNVQEVICTAVNNDFAQVPSPGQRAYTDFLFEGSSISGQAPPWLGNAEKGSEVWYGYITPFSVYPSDIDFVDINGDGVDEIHIKLSDTCSFYLNLKGNIVGRGIGDDCTGESKVEIFHSTR